MWGQNDPAFQTLHHTMDSVYRKLQESGVGAQKQQAETFTIEEENTLWESGVLGLENPKNLLHAVFYGNGKNFCLRGGNEHRDLKLSQLSTLRMVTDTQKMHQKMLAQLHVKKKCVDIFRNPEAGDRCHCRVLDLYISKLPSEAKDKDLFYVLPMDKIHASESTYERLFGTTAFQLVATSFHRWYQKYANLQISLVTKPPPCNSVHSSAYACMK